MAEKIDGHVHWNGGIWQFYKSLQENLACEFSDHRTCKLVSDTMNAAAEEAERLAAAVASDAVKIEVSIAAAAASVQSGKDEISEAGRRKHEATRQNGLVSIAAQNAAKAKATAGLTGAKMNYDAVVSSFNSGLDVEMKAAIDAQIAKQQEIDATDFAAQVHDENVAAALAAQKAQDDAAKAQADADAKAQANAKAKTDADAAQQAADDKAKADAEANAPPVANKTVPPAQAESPAPQAAQSATPETAAPASDTPKA